MIIQFTLNGHTDIEVAKFLNIALKLSNDKINNYIEDIHQITKDYGILTGNLETNSHFLRILKALIKKIVKTPHDDWELIPFILNDDETPVTVINAWLRYISKRGSPKTTKTYAYAIYDYLQFLEAKNTEWFKVTDDLLASYRIIQETTNSQHKASKKGNLKISKLTIQQRLLCVNLFYTFAVDYKYIEENPLTLETTYYSVRNDYNFLSHLGHKRKKEIPIVGYRRNFANKPIKFETHDNIKKWITSIKNERDSLIARILYKTGMRREEIIVWKVEEIPPRHSCRNGDQSNSVEFEIKGKGGSTRLISLTAPTFLRLWDYIDLNRKYIMNKYKNNEPDHGYVWVALKTGNPLQAVSLNHIFEEISERVGIKITPHKLRHSFAMQKRAELYECGENKNVEKILKELLGHAHITTTMDIYGHISPQELAEEASSNAHLMEDLT